MTIPDSDRTRRLNEPRFEPTPPKWHRTGTHPSPGAYWFYGYTFEEDPSPDCYLVLVKEDGSTTGMGSDSYSGFRSKTQDLYGEWYGPFEVPFEFGEAVQDEEDEE